MTSSCSPPWRSNSMAARAWRVVRRRKERPEYAASRMSACRKWKPPGTSGSRSTNSASLLHAVGVAHRTRLVDEGGDELAGKRLAENRGPAEKRPVGAVQPVDAARQHRFDRLRQLVPRAVTCGARGDELLEEQRVAAGTRGDRVGLLVGDLRAASHERAPWRRRARGARAAWSTRERAAFRRRRRTLPRRAAGSRRRARGASTGARRGGGGARTRPRPSSGRPRGGARQAPGAGARGGSRRHRGVGRDGTQAGARPPHGSTRR